MLLQYGTYAWFVIEIWLRYSGLTLHTYENICLEICVLWLGLGSLRLGSLCYSCFISASFVGIHGRPVVIWKEQIFWVFSLDSFPYS